jgi:hypothetical protein
MDGGMLDVAFPFATALCGLEVVEEIIDRLRIEVIGVSCLGEFR